MANTLRLTFAELEYLAAESETWPKTRTSLGLAVPESLSDVQAAGLASLFVRDLAITEGKGLRLDEGVAVFRALIDLPRVWIEFTFIAPEFRIAGGFGMDDNGRCLIASAAAPGVFEVAQLLETVDVGTAFVGVVRGLLSSPGRLILAVQAGEGTTELTEINVNAAGKWLIRGAAGQAGPEPLSEADAVAQVAALAERSYKSREAA